MCNLRSTIVKQTASITIINSPDLIRADGRKELAVFWKSALVMKVDIVPEKLPFIRYQMPGLYKTVLRHCKKTVGSYIKNELKLNIPFDWI